MLTQDRPNISKHYIVDSHMKLFIPLLVLFFMLTGWRCKNDDTPSNSLTDINNTLGYGLLSKVAGIWSGPVVSATSAGNFPQWIVDFRPISENQISAKNELDKRNDIHMSFFIAKYNNEYRVSFRSGGLFSGMTRVSYFLADSVVETSSRSFYRFSEILNGRKRASTELTFKGDSLIMRTFTNHNNTLTTPTLHMTWRAKLQDITTTTEAIAHFDFPKKTLSKDLTDAFNGQTEAVFFNTSVGDPYTEAQQPYLGQAFIHYSYTPGFTPDPQIKTILIITTQPLINGTSYNSNNLKFISRYVVLEATDPAFVFTYMHPGHYFLYALYDADGNQTFSSGDWASTLNAAFEVPDHGMAAGDANINFEIP